MLTLEDLQKISRRYEEHRDRFLTEESIKIALVLPLIKALDYDYHNPSEVAAELAAYEGKNERVDYAIMRDGKPIILIECKALGKSLSATPIKQLTGYFNKTNAAIGVLTNGVVYKFFTDLNKASTMDQSPFLEVDIREADQSVVAKLKRFGKDRFDSEEIKAAAETAAVDAKVIRGVKANMEKVFDNLDDEFPGALLRDVGADTIEESRRLELVEQAFHQFASEHSGPDGWQSLSNIRTEQGDNKNNNPTEMMFPDNSREAITGWNQVVVEVVQWLTDNERLGTSHCPIRDPDKPNKHLVATTPKHPDGIHFNTRAREEVKSLYVETHYPAPEVVRNANTIIKHVGMNASQFKLRWERSRPNAPAQAPAATISDGHLPVARQTPPTTPAPNGGWCPLSKAKGIPRTTKLQGIVFPDDSSVTTKDWNELTVEIVRWLTDNNHLTKAHCPIQTRTSKTQFVVAEQPVRPSGEPHPRMTEVNNLWVVDNLYYDQATGNARVVIQHVGMDPAHLKVQY